MAWELAESLTVHGIRIVHFCKVVHMTLFQYCGKRVSFFGYTPTSLIAFTGRIACVCGEYYTVHALTHR